MKRSQLTWMLALAASISTASAQAQRGERRPPQEPPVPPIFAELDTNRDRVLTEDELVAAFKILDKNKDGEITLEELRMPPPEGGRPPREPKTFKAPQGPPPNRPPSPPLVTAMDTDHDGTISAEEFDAAKALDHRLRGDGQWQPGSQLFFLIRSPVSPHLF